MNEKQFCDLIESINSLGKIDWVTVIISILGVLMSGFIAFWIAKYQVDKSEKQFQKQIDENRELEKELFFYKSRYDTIGACINSIDSIIDSFKKSLADIRNTYLIGMELEELGPEKFIIKKSDEMYEPKFIIDKFFENYHRIIWESYFKNKDIVDLEREIKSKSIRLYNLFSKFQSYEIDSLNEDFPVISYALEGYIVNELMILQNLYMTLNGVNSIYFTDNQHEEALIKTLLETNEKNRQKIEKERDEWERLLNSKDKKKILTKKKELYEMTKESL